MSRITLWIIVAAVVSVGAAGLYVVPASGQPADPPKANPTTGPTTRPAGDRGDREHSFGAPLTEAQTAELLGVLKQRLPERYDELMKLKAERPGSFEWRMRMTWRWYQHWRDLPEDIQQAVIAEDSEAVRSVQLARSIREAKDPAEKARLTKRLEESLNKQFEAEIKHNQYRLEQLKAQIQRLEKELKDQSQNRQAIIEDRLQRHLSGEAATQPWRRGSGTPKDDGAKDKEK